MREKVIAYNRGQDLIRKGDRIIVGISGGRDSVCLLHILNSLKEEFSLSLYAVHVNHCIRGADADEDAVFVADLTAAMGISCYIEKVDVREEARMKKISEEEAGRNVRYEVMEMIRVRKGYDKIAVAHHQDDVAETVLFNLLRGTGPRGLSGIAPKREYMIRPILFASLEEIDEYVKKNKLRFRMDSTNKMPVYSRNKIRLQVFPLLEREINSKAKLHVAEAAGRIAMQNQYIEKQAKKAYLQVVRMEEGEYNYEVETFGKLEAVIRVEILRLILQNLIPHAKDIDQKHYQMIQELEGKEVGKKVNLPEGVVVQRTYESIRFYCGNLGECYGSRVHVQCEFPFRHMVAMDGARYCIRLQIRDVEEKLGEIPQKDYTKWFDYDKIKGNIFLRTPLEGDFLTLNDKGDRKKLSRYFIDEKVPARLRGCQLLLADGSHVMVILASGRISEAYKVTGDTKRLLVLTKERVL